MALRLPGVLCQFAQSFHIDTGTLCRGATAPPGPAGRPSTVKAATAAGAPPKLMIDAGVLQPELISAYTRQFIKSVMGEIKLEVVYITSGIRPPERQAKTMYENIVNKGVSSQHKLYAAAGRKVVQVYSDRLETGDDEDDIIDAMTAEIYELLKSGQRVSKHCVSEEAYSALNVIDISHSRMPVRNRLPFEKAILKLQNAGKISKFISPAMKGGEPAYHLEIPQP